MFVAVAFLIHSSDVAERMFAMEFNERLQLLRKQKGITQEELAAALFVSRTAVSKWESGRGYPSIDSLKALAKYYSVTIDGLLSGDEALSIAEEDHKRQKRYLRDLVFGLLDCGVILLLFLPLFREKTEDAVYGVSLLALSGIRPYLRFAYFAALSAMILSGIMTLALQRGCCQFWERIGDGISLALNAAGVFLLIISPQPYAAAFLFAILTIKTFLYVKTR